MTFEQWLFSFFFFPRQIAIEKFSSLPRDQQRSRDKFSKNSLFAKSNVFGHVRGVGNIFWLVSFRGREKVRLEWLIHPRRGGKKVSTDRDKVTAMNARRKNCRFARVDRCEGQFGQRFCEMQFSDCRERDKAEQERWINRGIRRWSIRDLPGHWKFRRISIAIWRIFFFLAEEEIFHEFWPTISRYCCNTYLRVFRRWRTVLFFQCLRGFDRANIFGSSRNGFGLVYFGADECFTPNLTRMLLRFFSFSYVVTTQRERRLPLFIATRNVARCR